MKFVLEIDCDNDAFEPSPNWEIGRILREAAVSIEAFGIAVTDNVCRVKDANGTTVAYYELKKG